MALDVQPTSSGDDVAVDTAESSTPEPSRRTAADLVRRHGLMAVLLAAGVALRTLFLVGFWPAFFIDPDSLIYVRAAHSGVLSPTMPFGYSALLALFEPTGSYAVVAIAQHVLGVGLALLLYAFLLRRGLPGWLAAVGCAPVLLDAWQVSLEHYIMSDTLFEVALTAGFMLLLWRSKPGPWRTAGAGLLLAVAGLTRTVGLPLIAIVLVYLLVKRVGWRPVATFAVAAALPVLAYAVVYHGQHGVYALGENNARRYYGRAAQIVDCDRVTTLTAQERSLCPQEPRSQRQAPDVYGLFPGTPASELSPNDPIFASFDSKVFHAQPGDLAWQFAKDFSYFFRYGSPTSRNTCLDHMWVPMRTPAPINWCYPHLAHSSGFSPTMNLPGIAQPTAATHALRGYGPFGRTPGWSLALAVLLAAFAAAWGGRRYRPGDRLDAALLVVSGLAMLVLAIVGAMFDVRYAMPSIPLIWVGGALAAHCLWTSRRRASTATT